MSQYQNKIKKLNDEGKDLRVRGLKLKAIVTEEQFVQINKTCGCAFLVANMYKNWKDRYYYNYKYNFSMGEFKYYLTHIIKASNEYNFLKEVDKFALESAIESMDNAYNRFFKKESGYPKFKNKHKDKRSYTTKFTNNNIKLIKINKKLYIQLPKLKLVEVKNVKNKLIGKLLTNKATISNVTVKIRNKNIYISIQTEEIIDLVNKIKIDKTKIAAGDLGISTLLDLYNGKENIKFENHKYLNQSLDKLRKEQKRLSKMQQGSNNYNRQKEKINKLHLKISNQRKDNLHKLSRKIANENQVYISEDLSIVNMVKNKKLARSINDCGWGMLNLFIQYKIEDKGGYFIKVNKFYPSSKTCSKCGYKKTDLKLNERSWTCPMCGQVHDRDSNASINLRNEGIKILKDSGLI